MIRVEQLSKSYGASLALDGVSFEVKAGEIMGFLGPNGAGKTTTMKILTGYMPPTSGQAWVNDFDILTQSLEARRTIGYLPENNPLYLDFTVEEALIQTAEVFRLAKSERRSAIDRVVAQCGLESVYYKPCEAISKGFRQRVGLAQALIGDPQTLILDEPTVGLDPKQIIEIRELIKSLGRERTVLISTHIMQEVQAVCDQVTIIHQGRVVAAGTPDQLMADSEKQAAASLYVKLDGPVKSVQPALEKLAGVSTVNKLDTEKKGRYGYEVFLERGADVRSDVFDLATAKGWTLVEMTPRKVSLEDVFLQVTK